MCVGVGVAVSDIRPGEHGVTPSWRQTGRLDRMHRVRGRTRSGIRGKSDSRSRHIVLLLFRDCIDNTSESLYFTYTLTDRVTIYVGMRDFIT